jgi:hypothetical protein
MPKTQSYGIDGKREFSGEAQAARLIAWLNEASKDKPRERIRSLLRDIRASIQAGDTLKRQGLPLFSTADRRLEKLTRRISDSLRRYKFYPFVWATTSRVSVWSWMPAHGPDGKPSLDADVKLYTEFKAVRDIMGLAGAKLLPRIKECRCGKWMFLRFSHQRFCSSKCREKEFRSSPESKAYRREKAREYYWLHKSGKVK